jgi:peptidoglycan hydrolase-like protein with peptidoglycan-binding domain
MSFHKTAILSLFLLFAIGGFLGASTLIKAANSTVLPVAVSVPQGISMADQIKILRTRQGILESELNYVSPEYFFSGNIGLESVGAEVTALQKFLNGHGYPVAESGPGSAGSETSYFGPGTEAALAKFQSANGIVPADGYLNGRTMTAINPPRVSAQIVASSSNQIFAWPHAITKIGDRMVVGTIKENPGRVVIFTNPNDLSQYLATTTPGFMNLADVDYDAVHNRLYFVSSRTDNDHMEILSMNPDTLAWTPVFEFNAVTGIGRSTIATDGSYVYAATESTPAYMIKVRISDWSLQKTNAFPDGPGFHSSTLREYADHGEWYISTYSVPSVFYKVNVNDFSYTSTVLTESGDITNDVYFRPVDDRGGLYYVPSENGFGADVVNTETMSSTHYAVPDSYGFFSDGVDLYSVAPHDHQIIQYPGFNFDKPTFFQLAASFTPNEWFKTSNGNTYFTDYNNPAALYRYAVSPR